jgi:hypothetical protein
MSKVSSGLCASGPCSVQPAVEERIRDASTCLLSRLINIAVLVVEVAYERRARRVIFALSIQLPASLSGSDFQFVLCVDLGSTSPSAYGTN